MEKVLSSFEPEARIVALGNILPLKTLSQSARQSSKYQQIAASIAAVGIIEPLIIARSRDAVNRFLLLDGHLRYAILVATGVQQTRCLVATDDEAFTYNKRINRLATIQEHLMIVRAIERGVPEERLAKALNVDVRGIRRRRNMLVGISADVVDLLKDRCVNSATFAVLRKMKPMRQLEAAELMVAAGNYSFSYARAMLAATRQGDLVKSDQPKKIEALTVEQMARMEREMESLQQDVKTVEARYGDDVLHLVIASAYLARLVANPAIDRYLTRHHPELLAELKTVIAAASLEQGGEAYSP